jgi:hypothetical protein
LNTRVKHLILPLGGAVAASALLGASMVSTAEAAPVYTSKPLASQNEASTIAAWWLQQNGLALKQATQYRYDYKVGAGERLKVGGGPAPDSKPGVQNPTGHGKVKTTKIKNVNLPRNVGKVFFLKDGKPQWCSATSIDSKYKNLVVTAGHCVYDDKSQKDVLDKWVFVPGYYKGKAPFGIYVGKQAFTHYDFAVYEDYDKDYAFVTVYNGIKFGPEVEVSEDEWNKFSGDKWTKNVEISKEEYFKCKLATGWHKKSHACWVVVDKNAEQTSPDAKNAVNVPVEVSYEQWKKAPGGWGRAWKKGEGYKDHVEVKLVTKAEYDAYTGPGTKVLDPKGNFKVISYKVQHYVKVDFAKKFYRTAFIIGKVTDAGPLGKNVGGQGFAWNQERGITVFAFGYPAAEHPDGSKPFTGVTLKWAYGKTYTAINTKLKAEESIGLKTSMTGGADGGPFIWQYSSAKRSGYVVSTISWLGDSDDNGRIDFAAGPYFDGETAAIYKTAANVWSGTIVSKAGAPTIPA